MARQRTATLSFTGRAPNTYSEPMDISVQTNAGPVATQFYPPFADQTFSYVVATVTGGGQAWVCPRTYKVTGIFIASAVVADDDFEIFHLYVNGADSGVTIQILNGDQVAQKSGQFLNLNPGDEVSWQFDAGGDGSISRFSLSLHLDPN